MRVQQARGDGAKGNQPCIFVLGDAHQFTHQGLTHKDECPSPFDLAVGAYPSRLGQRGVLHITKSFGIRPMRRHIQTGRGDLWPRA